MDCDLYSTNPSFIPQDLQTYVILSQHWLIFTIITVYKAQLLVLSVNIEAEDEAPPTTQDFNPAALDDSFILPGWYWYVLKAYVFSSNLCKKLFFRKRISKKPWPGKSGSARSESAPCPLPYFIGLLRERWVCHTGTILRSLESSDSPLQFIQKRFFSNANGLWARGS